jgi:hypothetical protein
MYERIRRLTILNESEAQRDFELKGSPPPVR